MSLCIIRFASDLFHGRSAIAGRVDVDTERLFAYRRRTSPYLLAILFGAILMGCSGSARFVAVPRDLDRTTVPQETVVITAKRFSFEPEVIHVRRGTLLAVKVRSIQGTHGFRLADFGIDETVEEDEEKAVEIYCSSPGEYIFRCSHFCGLGHFGMTGKLIVVE